MDLTRMTKFAEKTLPYSQVYETVQQLISATVEFLHEPCTLTNRKWITTNGGLTKVYVRQANTIQQRRFWLASIEFHPSIQKNGIFTEYLNALILVLQGEKYDKLVIECVNEPYLFDFLLYHSKLPFQVRDTDFILALNHSFG